jgi:hypothetical protein
MIDADWRELEKVANSLQAGGLNATAGQVAGQLLRDAISRLRTNPVAYPHAPQAETVRVSEGTFAPAKRRAAEPAGSRRGVTYLVGAGINRGILGQQQRELPLARDFFRYVLGQPDSSSGLRATCLQPLWDFIGRYWHMSKDALKAKDFDLEECFTLLELQRLEATKTGNIEVLRLTSELESLLAGLLGECFGAAEHWLYFSPPFAGSMVSQHQAFGRRIYEEQAAVLTFNYDTLLERAVACGSPLAPEASRPRVVHDPPCYDDIPDIDARWSWNSRLAYKVHFDELVVRPGGAVPEVGEKYYASLGAREKEHPPFLKLHGSVDWYYRSGYTMVGEKWIESNGRAPRTRWMRHFPQIGCSVVGHDGEVLLPLLITPVLNKPVDEHPRPADVRQAVLGHFFHDVWQRARDVLKTTKTLVVAGYSFPPTDFHVRRLLREAFADHALDELCVVNPDTSVASVVRDLCNFHKPIFVCRDIAEYLSRTT